MSAVVGLDLCGMAQKMNTHWGNLPPRGKAAGRLGIGAALGLVAFLAAFESDSFRAEFDWALAEWSLVDFPVPSKECLWPHKSCQGVSLDNSFLLKLSLPGRQLSPL